MATNKEFSFDDDGDDFSLEPESFPPPKRPAGGGGGSKRVLLLLLLLVAAGAGAYYYLYGGFVFPPPAPSAQKVAVPVKAPVPPSAAAKPAQPAPAAGKPPAASPAAVTPAPATAQPVAGKPAQPAPAAPPVAVKPTQPAPAAPPVTAQPVPAVPAAKPVAVIPDAPAPATPPVAVKPVPPAPLVPLVPLVPVAQGRYRLSAGAFLVKANLLDAERRIRKLGYEPQRSTVKRSAAMTRLRIGRFSPHEAAARLAELRVKYPEAFTIKQGDKVVLYAGSYKSINLARSFADRLFLNDGIHVDEEPVTVPLAMTVLHFGAFAERAEADAAAKSARGAGLDDIAVVESR